MKVSEGLNHTNPIRTQDSDKRQENMRSFLVIRIIIRIIKSSKNVREWRELERGSARNKSKRTRQFIHSHGSVVPVRIVSLKLSIYKILKMGNNFTRMCQD